MKNILKTFMVVQIVTISTAMADPCKSYTISVGQDGNRYMVGRGCTADNTPYGFIQRNVKTAKGSAEARVVSLQYPEDCNAINAAALDITANGFGKADVKYIENYVTPLLIQAANAETEYDRTVLQIRANEVLAKYLATRGRSI